MLLDPDGFKAEFGILVEFYLVIFGIFGTLYLYRSLVKQVLCEHLDLAIIQLLVFSVILSGNSDARL